MVRPKKVSKSSSAPTPLVGRFVPNFSSLKKAPPHELSVEILPQPNETTCGPTCLHAVYRYYGDKIELNDVIKEVHSFEGGGTLAVWLACHALERGYKAHIYTYNMQTFDPTWFDGKKINLIDKLNKQKLAKNDDKLYISTEAYTQFLEKGGEILFEDLTRNLLRQFLTRNIPILTGLNSNFLYRSKRTIPALNKFDDVLGEPEGHFVVLRGYDKSSREIFVADPYATNPYASQKYRAPIDRVISAILLGILTYDANFLIIYPKTT